MQEPTWQCPCLQIKKFSMIHGCLYFSTGFNIISKVFFFYWTFHIFIMYFENGTMGTCPPPMWIWAHSFSDNVSLLFYMNVFTSLLVFFLHSSQLKCHLPFSVVEFKEFLRISIWYVRQLVHGRCAWHTSQHSFTYVKSACYAICLSFRCITAFANLVNL